jgi:hypothetical protein
MPRRWDLDALRGLMLVMMTLTHLPTRFSASISQPFGFVSAAEGFVLLSAFMAGSIYTRRAMQQGIPAMREAFLVRALKLYACQLVLLLFVFTLVAKIGVALDQPAVTNMLSFYLRDPYTAVWSGVALIYSPPLVDILPLYVVLMLASPWVLTFGLRHGWTSIMVVSVASWFLAQFDLAKLLYDAAVVVTGFNVPFSETGSFQMFAWQFIWMLGLWMGSSDAAARDPRADFPRRLIAVAGTIALVCFIWRHAVGQTPFGTLDALNLMFDKWHLGPLRLINFFALLVLTLHFGPWLRSTVRCRFLETLGAASLPVFCAHLVIVLLALAMAGAVKSENSLWADVALIAGSFAVLYTVARVFNPMKPRRAVEKEEESAGLTAHAVR